MQGLEQPRIAVLVDGDQHLSSLRAIREAAAAEGSVLYSEVFADWETPARSPWKGFAQRSGYDIVQVPGGVKNAADEAIALRVKGMLEGSQVDGFWIASSDRDFAEAARLIIESTKSVTIVLATSRFPKELQSRLCIVNPYGPLPPEWAEEAARRIRVAIQAVPSHEGRAFLSDLSVLSKLDPTFSPVDFGFGTLIELLEHLPDHYRVTRWPGGGAVFVEMIT